MEESDGMKKILLVATGGTIAGNGGLDMQTRVLGNSHGTISAAGSAPSRVAASGAFDNTGGTLIAAGDTSVAAGTLHNQGGSVVAAGDAALKVVVDRLLDNSGKGTLAGPIVGGLIFGILPEVHLPDRGSGSTDGAEYYKYNPHKEG